MNDALSEIEQLRARAESAEQRLDAAATECMEWRRKAQNFRALEASLAEHLGRAHARAEQAEADRDECLRKRSRENAEDSATRKRLADTEAVLTATRNEIADYDRAIRTARSERDTAVASADEWRCRVITAEDARDAARLSEAKATDLLWNALYSLAGAAGDIMLTCRTMPVTDAVSALKAKIKATSADHDGWKAEAANLAIMVTRRTAERDEANRQRDAAVDKAARWDAADKLSDARKQIEELDRAVRAWQAKAEQVQIELTKERESREHWTRVADGRAEVLREISGLLSDAP